MITGANAGIGLETARGLAAMGGASHNRVRVRLEVVGETLYTIQYQPKP